MKKLFILLICLSCFGCPKKSTIPVETFEMGEMVTVKLDNKSCMVVGRDLMNHYYVKFPTSQGYITIPFFWFELKKEEK